VVEIFLIHKSQLHSSLIASSAHDVQSAPLRAPRLTWRPLDD